MATGTIVLRPSRDVSLTHKCSRGSQGYILIYDNVADDDSTYIYHNLSSTSTSNHTSTFILTGEIPSGKIKINEVRLYSRARKSSSGETANYHCYFGVNTNNGGNSANSGTSATLSQNYSTINENSTEMVNELNNYLNTNDTFPTISVAITTSGRKSSNKNNDGYIRVTQVYMEIDYETIEEQSSLYVKENGVWNKYTKIYIKSNNNWIEQQNFENIFNSNINYVKGEVQ